MNFTNLRIIFFLFVILAACIVGYIQTTRLNSLALVSGIGIEKKDENYIVSLQIYNPEANKKEASDEIGGYTYSEKGKTVHEAIKKLEKNVPDTIFIETLQVVALGENLLLEEGLGPLLDFLIRSPRIPANIQMVVIKDVAPKLFFQLFTPDQNLSSLHVRDMLNTSKNRWGTFEDISAERIKSLLEDHTSDIVLPYINIEGEIKEGLVKNNIEQFTPNTSFSLAGLSIFNRDKLQSYLTFDESNMFALMRGVNQNVSMTFRCPSDETYFTLKTIQTTSSLYANTSPVSFHFKVHVKGNLEELNCKKDLTKPESVKEMEALIEKSISEELSRLLEIHYSSEVDFLGLKDALYRQHPMYFKRNKKKLDTVLSDAQVKLDVKMTLVKLGHIKKISQ